MTDEEKRQQKATLLLEYHEAEEDLKQLREKAARMAQPFLAVGDFLTRASRGQPRFGRDEGVRKSFEYMRPLEALALIDEIDAAHEKLADLGRRKAALGLP